MIKRIFKNSSYLLGAQALTKVLSFFYNIYIIANLSKVEDYGLYIVALSYFSLLSSLSDFGISQYVIRELSVEKNKASCLLCNIIMLRLTVVSVIFSIMAIFIYLTDPNKMRAALILIGIVAVIPECLALSVDSIFIALQKLYLSALGIITLSVATTLVGILLLSQGFGVIGVGLALVVGYFVYALYGVGVAIRLRINFFDKVTVSVLKTIIRQSLPYGILGLLGLIYFKVDAIMLSYMKGSYDTGIYGAAYKFLEAVVFIPSAVTAAMFPVVARLHLQNFNEVKKVYFSALKALVLLSVFIVFGYYFILPVIIKLFLPNYLPSILSIRILAFTIPFMFAHIPGSLVLISSSRYLKDMIKLSFITLSFNVILNFILIPHYGYIGTSISTVLSEIVTFLIFFSFLQVKVFKDV